MEPRTRFSKRYIALVVFLVALGTLVILITEGMVAFGGKTESSSDASTANVVAGVKSRQSMLVVANASDYDIKKEKSSTPDDDPCRQNNRKDGDVLVSSACRRCHEHERSHVLECNVTDHVERTVTCRGGRGALPRYRACTVAIDEAEQNFFVFEACNVGLGVVAYVVVAVRRKQLDYSFAKKIEQRLAGGV